MVSVRDPYPFEKFQNDDNFQGRRDNVKLPYKTPVHLAQNQDPWNRLNACPTLSSARHEIYHYDGQAPRDSLDFVLKSKYDHHNAFFKPKNETLVQPETMGEEQQGRQLKNRVKIIPDVVPELNHPLRQYKFPMQMSIHSRRSAIESHHSAATNGGYSRKHDGGCYCP